MDILEREFYKEILELDKNAYQYHLHTENPDKNSNKKMKMSIVDRKNLYNVILQKLRDGSYSFIAPASLNKEEIMDLIKEVHYDHPLFFNLSNVYYFSHVGSSYKVKLEKLFSDDKYEEYYNIMMSKIKPFVEKVKHLPEYDKAMKVQEFIIKNTHYLIDEKGKYTHLCFSAMVFGEAQCIGIAKLAKVIFDMLDMKSIVVWGNTKYKTDDGISRHAWNMVNVDGSYYHMDITFDLWRRGSTGERYGLVDYTHFLLTHMQIIKDHTQEDFYLFETGKENDYFRHTGRYLETNEEFENYIKGCLERKEKAFDFRLPDTYGTYSRDKLLAYIGKKLDKYIRHRYSIRFDMKFMVVKVYLV